jgi:hypothetical protein
MDIAFLDLPILGYYVFFFVVVKTDMKDLDLELQVRVLFFKMIYAEQTSFFFFVVFFFIIKKKKENTHLKESASIIGSYSFQHKPYITACKKNIMAIS